MKFVGSMCTQTARSCASRQLLVLLLMVMVCYIQGIDSNVESYGCPSPCKCSSDYRLINCKGKNLHMVPSPFPPVSTHIILSSNQLTNIPGDSFAKLYNLSVLDLSHNKLGDIDKDAFTDCGGLTQLLLATNQLVTLHTSTFYQTVSLKILDVSQNQLKEIPNLRSISNLETLYLGDNKLTSFAFPSNYKRATKLKRVTLSNNPLVTSINVADFTNLSPPTALTQLRLTRCGIKHVAPGSFAPLHSSLVSLALSQNPGIGADTLQTILQDFANSNTLTSLELSDLGLTGVVPNTTFSVLGESSRLATINLSRNKLVTGIEEGAFSHLSYLTTLIIASTGIMEPPYLYDNNRLTNLDLSANSIRRYVSATRFPPSLTVLRLNDNNIAKLTASPFKQLTRLTLLTLNGNKLQEFDSESLDGLISLRTLDLSDNMLSYLPNGIFDAFIKLQTLDLHNNNLKAIKGNIFTQTLGMLTKLDMSGNGLSSFHPQLFRSLYNLMELSLSNNKLGAAFTAPQLSTYKGFLSGLKKLQVVNMSSNEVGILPPQMISGTSNLMILDLGINNIYSWDSQQTFKGSVGLQRLLLNSNRLALFNKTSFADLNNLSYLDLTNNPFACTCDMRLFRDWLKTTKVEVVHSDTYTCASPPYLLGTLVTDYDLDEIQCLPEWVWIITGVGAGVIFILVFICVAYRFRWRIRYSIYKCRTRPGHCWSSPTGEREPLLGGFRYAAMVSHCSKEACKEKIYRDILPVIDKNQSYPTHQGDFPIVHRELYSPRKHDITNIMDALFNSAATLVYICKHYRSDRRCEMELSASFERLHSGKKKSIIVLLAEENLDLKYLPPVLHTMCNQRECLEWTPDVNCAHILKGKLAEAWRTAARGVDE